MLKKQLVDAIYNKVNAEYIESNKLKSIVLTKGRIEEVVDAFANTIIETVSKKEDVKIVGFGKFHSKKVLEREGTCRVGVRKGEPWKKPEFLKPAFKPYDLFINEVNGGTE